jgi:ABC-type branched-subunit amino acid transport system ATPase component
MTSGVATLDVADLTVDFGGLRALDAVSIRVDEGRTIGLIGPNGAGKTTLFDAVLGVVTPSSGHIHLFGNDVSAWAMHRRARLGLGRTFQRLELFGSLTVLENLIVAIESVEGVGSLAGELLRRPASIDVRKRAEGRADGLLELIGLTEHRSGRAADLTMGHARLLELGRALATKPRLLMLDEPSSGLNDEESAQLAELLRSVRTSHGLSMLVVEHDMEFVLGLSDHVYVLDFGRLIADGTPAQVQRDPVVRAAYLGQEETTQAPAATAKKRKPRARAARR